MLAIYLMFFSVLFAHSVNIKVIPNPKTLEDFEHEFKGCPANSQCDLVMGVQLQRWKTLVDKLNGESKTELLEAFRERYGLPVEFYTSIKSQQGFRPLFFNSSCKNHNPKEDAQKIYQGMAFLKSMNENRAIIVRDQSIFEIPVGPLLSPQPVKVYFPDGAKTYQLPLKERPLFIRDKELYLLKEEEDLFFTLKVSQSGDWKVVPTETKNLSNFSTKSEVIACPKDMDVHPGAFTYTYCRTIWDDSTKKTVIVKLHEGCP